MDILENNSNKEKLDKFIEQKESKTVLGETEKNLDELGLDINLSDWLGNDKKLLNYAKLHLKDKKEKGFADTIKEQFLELKLSITCPYFADFKIFIDELQKGEDTSDEKDKDKTNPNSLDYIGQGHQFAGVEVSDIESQPLFKNPGTGVTRCAATARFNGLNFGLTLPPGNAYDAGEKAQVNNDNYKKTLPKDKINKKPRSSWKPIIPEQFNNIDDDVNFADIYLDSESKYGHRAVAFRDSEGERYILDPYTRVGGILNNKPKKLSDYTKEKDIVKAHFYNAPKYEFKSKEYINSKS